MIFGMLAIFLCIGWVSLLIAWFDDSKARKAFLAGTSLIIFSVIMVSSLGFTIPGLSDSQTDYSVSALCLAFIFVCLVMLIVNIFPENFLKNRSQWRG